MGLPLLLFLLACTALIPTSTIETHVYSLLTTCSLFALVVIVLILLTVVAPLVQLTPEIRLKHLTIDTIHIHDVSYTLASSISQLLLQRPRASLAPSNGSGVLPLGRRRV